MIYVDANLQAPICQGDIFRTVPRVELCLQRFAVLDEEAPREVSWGELLDEGDGPVTAVLPLQSVTAIVVSQDCDNTRARLITLAQIAPFSEILSGQPASAAKWISKITQHAKTNYRYFYLPADESVGFSERMGVDFQLLFQLPRTDLEAMRSLRSARLNDVAHEHFRETVAYYFRRYAYNEWYPFTRDEFEAYAAKFDEAVQPYPWQQPPSQ